MAELIEERGGVIKEGCHPGCVINCSQVYHDDEEESKRRAGFTKADDRLPDMFEETLPQHNTSWDFTGEELQQTLKFE